MNRVQPTMRMPYINRAFSSPDKRSATLSLIEKTIFSYMKLYSSSAYVPSSNGDNNNRKRRNYDDTFAARGIVGAQFYFRSEYYSLLSE